MSTDTQTDPPMQWFIVNTFSGYENTVKKALEDSIKIKELEECFEQILVPSEQVIEQRGKRKIKQTRNPFQLSSLEEELGKLEQEGMELDSFFLDDAEEAQEGEQQQPEEEE